MSALVWINEVNDGETTRHLGLLGYLRYCSDKASEAVPATSANTTLEQLVNYCEDEAESANYHSFCGAHEKLAAVIVEASNGFVAKRVFFTIAEAGGPKTPDHRNSCTRAAPARGESRRRN